MSDYTHTDHEPQPRRWQDGWEIPVNVGQITDTDEDGNQTVSWRYNRIVTPSLAELDVAEACRRAGLPDAIEQALAAANPRLTAAEARLDAVAAKAEQASVTAQEVAAAAKGRAR